MPLGRLEIQYVRILEKAGREGIGRLMRLQGVRAYMQQSRIFVGMVLILIFGEVLGLYGYVLSMKGMQRDGELWIMANVCIG